MEDIYLHVGIDEEGWTWEIHPSHYYFFKRNIRTGAQVQKGYVVNANVADHFMKLGYRTYVTPNTQVQNLQHYTVDNPMPIVSAEQNYGIPDSGNTHGIACYREDAPPFVPSKENLHQSQLAPQQAYAVPYQGHAPVPYYPPPPPFPLGGGYTTTENSFSQMVPPLGFAPPSGTAPPGFSPYDMSNNQLFSGMTPPEVSTTGPFGYNSPDVYNPNYFTQPPVWNQRFLGGQHQTGYGCYDPMTHPPLPLDVPPNQWLKPVTSNSSVNAQQSYSLVHLPTNTNSPSEHDMVLGCETKRNANSSEQPQSNDPDEVSEELVLTPVYENGVDVLEEPLVESLTTSNVHDDQRQNCGESSQGQGSSSVGNRATDVDEKTLAESSESTVDASTQSTQSSSKESEADDSGKDTVANGKATLSSSASIESTDETAKEASDDIKSFEEEPVERVEHVPTSTSSTTEKSSDGSSPPRTNKMELEPTLSTQPTQSSSSTSTILDCSVLAKDKILVPISELSTKIFEETWIKYEDSNHDFGLPIAPPETAKFPTKTNATIRRDEESRKNAMDNNILKEYMEKRVVQEQQIENEKEQFSSSLEFYTCNFSALRAYYLANRSDGYGKLQGLQRTIVDFLEDKCVYTLKKIAPQDHHMINYLSWQSKDFERKREWRMATFWKELHDRFSDFWIIQQDVQWLYSFKDTGDLGAAMHSLYQFILHCPQNPPGAMTGFTSASFTSLAIPNKCKERLAHYLTRSWFGRLQEEYPQEYDNLPSAFEKSLTKDYYQNKFNENWTRNESKMFMEYWAVYCQHRKEPGLRAGLQILSNLNSDLIDYDMSKLNDVEEKTTDKGQFQAFIIHYLRNVFGEEIRGVGQKKEAPKQGSQSGSNAKNTKGGKGSQVGKRCGRK